MIPSNQNTSSSQSKFILGTLAVIGVVLLILYFLVLNSALSGNGVLSLYVPSKYGGDDFSLDSGKFAIMHAVAAGVAVYFAAISLWLSRRKQSMAAMFMTIGLVAFAAIYSSVILGNVLYEEFGSFASVIGVIASLGAASIFSSYTILKFVRKKD